MQHAVNLAAKKRCPNCGEKLDNKKVDQECGACGTVVFADPQLRQNYLEQSQANLAKCLVVSALLGLVPVLGMIMGIIYYRLDVGLSIPSLYILFSRNICSLDGALIILRVDPYSDHSRYGSGDFARDGITQLWQLQRPFREKSSATPLTEAHVLSIPTNRSKNPCKRQYTLAGGDAFAFLSVLKCTPSWGLRAVVNPL